MDDRRADRGQHPGRQYESRRAALLQRLDDDLRAAETLQRLRGLGFRIALDDFGTGYSSLFNIRNFALDCLKIDKSFIDTLTTNSASYTIAEHIIEMAHSLRLKTIAEGVETADQVNWLRKRGVRYCQGWYFAKAMPPQEFRQWLANAPGLLSPCM